MSRHRSAYASLLVLGLGAAGACGAPSTPRNLPAHPAPQSSNLEAQWNYHPAAPEGLLARVDLPDGNRLFAGKRGERWLAVLREGKAQAATMLADEELVDIAVLDGGFAFIGKSGSIFRSDTPLGPFTDVARANPATRRIAAAGRYVIGIDLEGKLVRSTDGGRTFGRASFSGPNAMDVALTPNGRAMVLSSPEQLWLSRDGGASFERSSAPTVGARWVSVDASGELVAPGLFRSLRWAPDGSIEVSERPFERPPMDLLTELAPAPRATSLLDGSALLEGTSYLEVIAPQQQGEPWSLARGQLTDRLSLTPIDGSRDCKQAILGGSSKLLVLGCLASTSDKGGALFPGLRLLISRDGGMTFTSKPTGLLADDLALRITALATGEILLTGACKPDVVGDCVPSGPFRLIPSRGSAAVRYESVEQSEVPASRGASGPIRVSPDGKRLYSTTVLATRNRPAVIISDDQGATFRAVALELGEAFATPEEAEQLLTAAPAGTLAVGERGELSWTIYSQAGTVWVVMDSSARVRSAMRLPKDHPFLAAVGSRGLAFSRSEGLVYQSENGGKGFDLVAKLETIDLFVQGQPSVFCGWAGCAVGNRFSRTGWGLQPGGVVRRDSPPVEAREARPRTPIVCELSDVSGQASGRLDDISAQGFFRGDATWSSLGVDMEKGAVELTVGKSQPTPRTEVMRLITPAAGAVALTARRQAEGAIALRYDVAKTARAGSTTSAELVWANLLAGQVHRARISIPQPPEQPPATGKVGEARVSVLSIAQDGVYLRFDSAGGTGKTWFVGNNGRMMPAPDPEWPRTGLSGALQLNTFLMRIDGQHVALAAADTDALLRLRPDSSVPEVLGLLGAPARADGFESDATWAFGPKNAAALLQTVLHGHDRSGYALIIQPAATGPVAAVIDAPTQLDLSDPPTACTPEQMAATFRMTSPPHVTTRHPVLVRVENALVQLKTDRAVMQGEPGSACARGFEAVSNDGAGPFRALVSVDDPSRSWLFRDEGGGKLRWRLMQCKFDASAAARLEAEHGAREVAGPVAIVREVRAAGSASAVPRGRFRGFACQSDSDLGCDFSRCINGRCGICSTNADCHPAATCQTLPMGSACVPTRWISPPAASSAP